MVIFQKVSQFHGDRIEYQKREKYIFLLKKNCSKKSRKKENINFSTYISYSEKKFCGYKIFLDLFNFQRVYWVKTISSAKKPLKFSDVICFKPKKTLFSRSLFDRMFSNFFIGENKNFTMIRFLRPKCILAVFK